LTFRLSVMMFLQYAIIGAWSPVFSPYLKSLRLTNTETAWVCSTSALGSVLAPLVWGQIADRWLAAERCISLCAAIAGLMLWWGSQTSDPVSLFWIFLTFWLFQMPIMSLGTALTFRHLLHPEREFGPIRLWGTVGWMAASWTFSFWLGLRNYPKSADHFDDSFRFGSLAAWMIAIYAFTLPPTPPLPQRSQAGHAPWRNVLDAPVRAFRLFRVPAFSVYCVCLFVLYATWPFNMQMTGLLIEGLIADSKWLSAILSVAQTTEVATLATLPFILGRLGQKGTMVVGITSWWGALTALAIGGPLALVAPSLLLHGLFICCFLVAGQVFVNRIAQHDFRASSQGLLVLINGMGQIVGNFLVSLLRDQMHDDYARVFLPAALAIGMLTVFFALDFHLPPPEAHEQP
jgi:nucleoside transporter